MSKKRRSRKKMKPYQVKLRVIGIMSIIVSLLVLWLPLPSKAVDGDKSQTHWQDIFSYTPTIIDDEFQGMSTERYIDLRKVNAGADVTTVPDPVNTDQSVVVGSGEVEIPEFAYDNKQKEFKTRIGVVGGGEGLFQNLSGLKKVDLSKITTSGATNLANMFSGSSDLQEINFGAFSTPEVTDFSNMFNGCTALKKLDLSKFDMNKAAKTDGMFTGCDSLETIESPQNVKSGITIDLPWEYTYTDVTNATYRSNTLPTVGTAAGNIAAGTSVTLTRVTAVDSLAIDPTAGVVEIGDTISLTITLLPTFAAEKGVTITSSDKDIATLGGSGVNTNTDKDSATATVGADGTVTVEVTGVDATTFDSSKKLHYDDVTIKVTSDGNDTNGSKKEAAATIRVWEKLVKATGVSVAPKSGSIKLNETTIVTATVSPSGATDQEVEWKAENADGSTNPIAKLTDNGDGTVTVSAAGTLLGDVYIKATTKDGGFTDYATITVTSPYEFKKVVDHRTDTSNQTLTTGTTSGQPTSSNAYLHIETDTDATKRAAIDSKLTGYAPKSCFNISKHNADTIGTGTSITDDLGTATITMALPGEFLTPSNASKQVKLYTYDGTNVQDISNAMVKTTVGTSGTIGAVRFAVSTADAELAKTYILALDPSATVTSTGFIFKVSDESTKTTPRATSGLPDKQTKDLYLVVDDSLGPVLKPLVNADATLTTYAQQYYYEVYLTDNNSLAKPTTPIDFGSIEITLPLPDGVDWQNGKLLLVSEHNGALDKQEVPKIVQNTSTGKECVQFTATHFSEHAILYDPATEYTITTTHTGGTTASTTAINGTDATAATAPAGADAAATVPIASTNTVTVTATPGDGYHFVRWTEGGAQVSTEASYTFTPTANRTLNAVFEANSTPTPGPSPTGPFRLTVDRLPTAGGTTATSPEQNAYNAGETVTVTATANTGYTFMYWADETGARLSSDASYQVTMDRDKRLYAVFAQEGEVAGAGRTMDAVVNVNIPDITIPAPQVTVGEPQVSVNIPAINVYADGASANAGTSGTFYPLAFTRPGNYADMPRTGTASMYRVMLTIILLMSGTVEVLLSIPAKKKRRVRTD